MSRQVGSRGAGPCTLRVPGKGARVEWWTDHLPFALDSLLSLVVYESTVKWVSRCDREPCVPITSPFIQKEGRLFVFCVFTQGSRRSLRREGRTERGPEETGRDTEPNLTPRSYQSAPGPWLSGLGTLSAFDDFEVYRITFEWRFSPRPLYTLGGESRKGPGSPAPVPPKAGTLTSWSRGWFYLESRNTSFLWT